MDGAETGVIPGQAYYLYVRTRKHPGDRVRREKSRPGGLDRLYALH